MSYLLITPCRNEEEYARRTLESVVQQSIKPSLWVIVDDGSTDSTPKILREYAEKYEFIRIVNREDRGVRKVGPGVIEAFYAGLDTVNIDDYSYICKFDLDLEIPPKYFEILIKKMVSNSRLGTCSGKPYYPDNDTGKLISEGCGDEMSVGMTKFYRVQCFKEIGGFVREVMWDGIDCHRCRMLGWMAHSYDEPELRFLHLRAMGSSHKNIYVGRRRHGYGQYFMGTSLPYMCASAVFRMAQRPFILGGLNMLIGYIESMKSGQPRYSDLRFRKFLRDYQLKCLILGKNTATELINQKIRKQYGV